MGKLTIEKLYEMQKILDERTIKKKGLEGQDLLPNTVLALQVKLSELANEWNGYKYWSDDQSPNLTTNCASCRGVGSFESYIDGSEVPCIYCGGSGVKGRPLLEAYVECLRFILSIARQIDVDIKEIESSDRRFKIPDTSTTNLFSLLLSDARNILWNSDYFFELYVIFRYLGDRLGLVWDQITETYSIRLNLMLKTK